MLLEDYAKSFPRDIPDYTKFRIRDHLHSFKSAYLTLPRQRLPDRISIELERRRNAAISMAKLFMGAIDEMDKQYLEIHRARKALFDYDTEDWGCKFDRELWRCDEMVNWAVGEPDMTPAQEQMFGSHR
jgi:hypothetical protein